MIPNKVIALFQFIDYLDNNKKEYINIYIPLVKEIKELNQKIYALDPENNYKDKQQADHFNSGLLPKFTQLNRNLIQPILKKLKELGIWQGDEFFMSIYSANINAIRELRKTCTDKDVQTIQSYEQKYIGFRAETDSNFCGLGMTFDYLDRVLKELFSFFSEKGNNVFETFETKTIEVKSVSEADDLLKQGNYNFSLPLDALNLSNVKQNKVKTPQQKSKLSDKQIVLFHIYNGDEITNDNKNDFARRWKKEAKTAGHKLYSIFNDYRRTTDRTGDPGTKRKLQYKISLIESVIPLLPTEKQEKPKDEVIILNDHLETNY